MPPISAARFSIIVDGYEIGSFSEIEGLKAEIETVEYMTSSLDRLLLAQAIHNLPTVSLIRARSGDSRMSVWNQSAMRNLTAAKKNCTLTMYNSDGRPVARYYLENAWPSKIDTGGLKSGISREVLETVTLTCDRIRRL